MFQALASLSPHRPRVDNHAIKGADSHIYVDVCSCEGQHPGHQTLDPELMQEQLHAYTKALCAED
jgi:hypothetical protein